MPAVGRRTEVMEARQLSLPPPLPPPAVATHTTTMPPRNSGFVRKIGRARFETLNTAFETLKSAGGEAGKKAPALTVEQLQNKKCVCVCSHARVCPSACLPRPSS